MSLMLPGLESLRAALDDEDEDLTNAELDRFLCYLVGIDSRIDRLVGDGLYRLKNGDHFMKFGYSSLRDYALGRLGIRSRRAQEMVCLESWVRDYPCIDQAWRLGRLSASHVDLLRKARIPVELDEDWAMKACQFTCAACKPICNRVAPPNYPITTRRPTGPGLKSKPLPS